MIQIVMVIICARVVLSQKVDPLCEKKVCPATLTCRVVARCTPRGLCGFRADCVGPLPGGNIRVCRTGLTVLKLEDQMLGDFKCDPFNPCPNGTYCNSDRMEYSRCCRSDPTNPIRPGACPLQSAAIKPCADECLNDGDCKGTRKCCIFEGCKRCIRTDIAS